MSATSRLLKSMYAEYAASVCLLPSAQYLYGTPLRPVVPLDIAVGGVFVLGAYPSARFAVVDGVTDVPVADNLGPFQNERWFDGARIREQPSARELRDFFLSPLNIDRSSCWITDLVKVFLFKKGHVCLGRRVPWRASLASILHLAAVFPSDTPCWYFRGCKLCVSRCPRRPRYPTTPEQRVPQRQ
jgi:hypothetical protein